jgi:hypothetical protein
MFAPGINASHNLRTRVMTLALVPCGSLLFFLFVLNDDAGPSGRRAVAKMIAYVRFLVSAFSFAEDLVALRGGDYSAC